MRQVRLNHKLLSVSMAVSPTSKYNIIFRKDHLRTFQKSINIYPSQIILGEEAQQAHYTVQASCTHLSSPSLPPSPGPM